MEDLMVQIIDIVKSFKGEKDAAVKGISLDIKEGEFLTMLGPSGCGKTTTLRIIAGFEEADSGKVFIDGIDVSSMAPYERNVNTVFQSYALFPHLNVFENVAFGLTIKKLPKDEIESKVLHMLKIVKMEGYENKMPDQLSGGQKQRVALARAIINNPKVLLLDEPFGALDLKLRRQMQLEIKHLQRKLGITFLFVTHDQEEAMTMSDRICVMKDGLVEQIGTPEEIYEKPKTRFVADFIGETNIFEGKIVYTGEKYSTVKMEDGQTIDIRASSTVSENEVCFAIRPENIKFISSLRDGDIGLYVTLKERTYVGSVVRTVVMLSNGREITISEPAGERYSFPLEEKGAYIWWNPENMVVMGS